MSLHQQYDEQRPTGPTVYVSTVDQQEDMRKGDVYVLYCKDMQWQIDCFVQTGLVNMMGIWQNQTDALMNAVFMIPMRGKVTDCYIHIGSERLRSVGLAERRHQPVQFNQPMVYNCACPLPLLIPYVTFILTTECRLRSIYRK